MADVGALDPWTYNREIVMAIGAVVKNLALESPANALSRSYTMISINLHGVLEMLEK
jgi:hypothetical protein